MTQIIEKFDFDDRPGLEKLGRMQQTLEMFDASIHKLTSSMDKMSSGISKNIQDIDKTMDNSAKNIGKTAGIYAELARQTAIFFGKAVAGLGELGKSNARISEGQDRLNEKLEKTKATLADKLAPVFFAIQDTFEDILTKAEEGANNLGNSTIVKIAAGVKGVAAAIGQLFLNIKNEFKLAKLDLQQIGLGFQRAFTIDKKKRSELLAQMVEIQNESKNIVSQNKSIGQAYRDAFQEAEKEIGSLVSSGYFKLKRVNKEAANSIEKVREAYAKLVNEVNNRIEQNRIESLEGIARFDAEEKRALELIDREEEQARMLAENAGEQFGLESAFLKLREQIQLQFEKERIEFLIEQERKRREEAIKANKAFYAELAPLEAEGQRTLTDIGIDAAKEQDERLQKRLEEINTRLKPKSFDDIKKDILESLNITEEEGKFILQNVGKALQGVEDLFTAGINARIADNDRLIQSIRERKGVVQAELDEELRLQKEGRENNVRSKKEELERLQRQEEAAVKERQKLVKKAQAAQILSDSVEQTSSLVTAAASIFKNFAKIPVIGLVLGTAAVAGLFILFNSIKAKAAAAAKPERLYRGGSLRGKIKKDSGYVNWLNGKNDEPGRGEGHRIEGSNIVVGGREMVVAERPANAQSDDFWNNMNAGKYNDIDLETTLDNPITNQKRINVRFEKRQLKIDKLQQGRSQNVMLTKEEMISIMEKHSKDLIRYFEAKPEFVPYSENQKIARIRKSGRDVKIMASGGLSSF